MKLSPFAVGRRWRCARPRNKGPGFDFVIIGPGRTPRYKRCRIDSPGDPAHGVEQDYSHEHLKLCAKLVTNKQAREDLLARQRAANELAARLLNTLVFEEGVLVWLRANKNDDLADEILGNVNTIRDLELTLEDPGRPLFFGAAHP